MKQFGIKLIWPEHLFPSIPYFDHASENLPALMNFKNDVKGHAIVSSLNVGDRCLVYVTGVQLFIWAAEFIGTLADGEAARNGYRIKPAEHHPFTLYLPIRFVARVEPWEKGAPRSSVCASSGVDFTPMEGDSYVPLSETQYERMYSAIRWSKEFPEEIIRDAAS